MTSDPFERPPQGPPQREPDHSEKQPDRTSLYGFNWSSPSRNRMLVGLGLLFASVVPLGLYLSDNGPDHPGLLVLGIPPALIGLAMAVWPER